MSCAPVGIVIPAFNAEPYLAQALDSLLAQTYPNWLAVVVDDGSTDGTLSLARAYLARDPRITVIAGPNGGISAARNAGRAALDVDYVCYLDADDVWLPDKLTRQLEAARHHRVDLVVTHLASFREDVRRTVFQPVAGPPWDRVLAGPTLAAALREACFFLPSGVMIKVALLDRMGGFDEGLRAAEDWDLWLRVAEANGSLYGLSSPLFLRRLHGQNHSCDQALAFWSNAEVMRRYSVDLGRPATLFRGPARPIFRNAFTLLGDAGRFHRLAEMFETYRHFDHDGYACRMMGALQRALPWKAFWFISRYGVIPLAWHAEGLAQRLGRSASSPPTA
jgi:glycosyltransferase involved in cell wall biosynthesis